MELKSLILGMAFSIGVFALKSGMGLYYGLAGTKSRRAGILARGIFAAAYLLVFAASGAVLEWLDPIAPGGRLSMILGWMQSAMRIHLCMAGLLLVWGLRLLLGRSPGAERSRSWLLLAVPCPVCATVICLSMGFLAANWPDAPMAAAAGLYLAFLAVSLTTAALMAAGQAASSASPEAFLGGAMLLVAAYFLLSVTILPNVRDLGGIYRMAAAPPESALLEIRQVIPAAAAAVAAFIGGFGARIRSIRRAA
jgi:predicted transporter